MNIYLYKLVHDGGAAPYVTQGLLSLAICKPIIRKVAKKGDLIFGFGANALDKKRTQQQRLIYIAEVTSVLEDGEYYKDRRYRHRHDCIYRCVRGKYDRRSDARFHDQAEDITHDLGKPPNYDRANVLLSADFRYFGNKGNDEYKIGFPRVKSAIESLGRGFRVHLDPRLRNELCRLRDEVWRSTTRKKIGSPSEKSNSRVSHREGGCGQVPPC